MSDFSDGFLKSFCEHAKTLMDKGAIYIYSGDKTGNANSAPPGTLLGIVTVDALPWNPHENTDNGLTMELSGATKLVKPNNVVWQFVGLAAGTARSFRYVPGAVADSQALDTSATYVRIDGRIAKTGSATAGTAEMTLTTLEIVPGAITTIDSFEMSF